MAGQEEVDVPGSPKRQKMEEPAPPSSSSPNPAPVVSSDENLPAASSRGGGRSAEKEAGSGDQPAAAASLSDKTPRRYINEGPEAHNPREHDAFIRDTTRIANRSLDFYNNKEGTNYKLHRPLLSWCNLFPDGLIIHANFRARNGDADPSAAGENNPPIELFFSETFRGYDASAKVLNCLILDKSRSDIRRGCAHCPSHIVKKSFYHPPVGTAEFGDNEEKDYAKYQLSESSGSETEPE